MKIIVTHSSPDIDAITAVWLLKRFLPGWEEAKVKFVPAGERLSGSGRLLHVADDARRAQSKKQTIASSSLSERRLLKDNSHLDVKTGSAFSSSTSEQPFIAKDPIKIINENEMIHVDTGDGPLDHHLTADESVSAASLAWDFIKQVQTSKFSPRDEAGKVQSSERWEDKKEAIERIVKIVVDVDHFKEVSWKAPLAFYHDFSLLGILDGLKFQKPNEDSFYVEFISQCLDALLHDFENRIWAEKEIAEKGIEFSTRFGKGLGVETINDSVIKLGQKMGFLIVVRKDPRKGYLRIKARSSFKAQKGDMDLTLVYEKFKKMDPNASWFLHVSKKMLLNGSPKNPKMRPTRLSLSDIIEVLKSI